MPLQPGSGIATFQPPGMQDMTYAADARARMLETGVQALGNVRGTFVDLAAHQAQMSGAMAGAKAAIQYDPKTGNLLPLTTLPEDQSLYSVAYREQAVTTYANAAVATTRMRLKEMALDPEMQAAPDKYAVAANAYVKTTLENVHPLAAGAIYPQLVDAMTTQYGNLVDNHIKAIQASTETQGQANLNNSRAEWATRLTDMGVAPGTSDVIENTLKTSWFEQEDRLRRALPNTYTAGRMQQDLDNQRRELWGWAIAGQARQMAIPVHQPDGSWKIPEDDLNKFIEQQKATLGAAGIATPDQFKDIEAQARASFALGGGQRKTEMLQQTVADQNEIAGNVGILTGQADQAMADWKMGKGFDELRAIEMKALTTNFDTDPSKNTAARADFLNKLNAKVLERFTDPNTREEMRLLAAVLDPNRAAGTVLFPDTRAGKQALLGIQGMWDEKANNLGLTALTATEDPAKVIPLLLDKHVGFATLTGNLPPRMKGEFTADMATVAMHDPQIAANVAATFQAVEHEAPTTITEDMKTNMAAWHDSFGDPKEYARIRAAQAGTLSGGADNIFQSTYTDLSTNPDKLGQGIQKTWQDSFHATGDVIRMFRSFFGFPRDTAVSYTADQWHEGVIGMVLGNTFGADAQRLFGYPPTSDLRVQFSKETRETLVAAYANAMRHSNDMDSAGREAMSELTNAHYGPSKLLMYAQTDAAGGRDMSGDMVFGQWSPEGESGHPPIDIARDISMAAARVWSKRPELKQSYVSADPANPLYSDWNKMGDDRHWSEEYRAGRLKMEPVDTNGHTKLLGYNVLGMVETGNGYTWIQLNPDGQLYNYDPAKGYAAQADLAGAPAGRAVAQATREAIPGSAGAAAAAVTGTAAAAVAAGEAKGKREITAGGNRFNKAIESFLPGTQPLTAPPSDILKGDDPNEKRGH